jgi:hypothetical protein
VTVGAGKARNLGLVRFVQQQEGRPVAKPNYSFEKRQRELAKKKKKEEKEREKAGRKLATEHGAEPATTADGVPNQASAEPPAMGPSGG